MPGTVSSPVFGLGRGSITTTPSSEEGKPATETLGPFLQMSRHMPPVAFTIHKLKWCQHVSKCP